MSGENKLNTKDFYMPPPSTPPYYYLWLMSCKIYNYSPNLHLVGGGELVYPTTNTYIVIKENSWKLLNLLNLTMNLVQNV